MGSQSNLAVAVIGRHIRRQPRSRTGLAIGALGRHLHIARFRILPAQQLTPDGTGSIPALRRVRHWWLFVQGDGPVLPGFDRSLAGIDQARRRRVSPPVSLPSSWTTPSDMERSPRRTGDSCRHFAHLNSSLNSSRSFWLKRV